MKRILLVDDELSILEALEDVLTSEGYRVEVARHGEEALRALAEVRPDLILMDLMMPVMDGHTLLHRLRDSEFRSIPVVVMSAGRFNGPSTLAPPFVAKPFELDHLLATIHRHLHAKAPD